VGGNFYLNIDRNRTKVGMKQLASKSALPMWCADPFASKSRTFSHSLGRLLPVEIIGFLRSERPVLMKAVAQINDSEKPRLMGRFVLRSSPPHATINQLTMGRG